MYARHSLVWLTAPGWLAAQASLARAPAAESASNHAAALRRWQENDWPLVARRSDADLAPGEISLGLALPPDAASGIKVRIPLRAPAAAVARTADPLALKAVLPALPAHWSGAMQGLIADSVGLSLRVFGSLALQALTGAAYVGPASDIDLLLYPATERQLRSGLALLEKYAALLPLDGEIVFPRGAAVAWKEWRAAEASGARVLVKERDMVRLAPLNLLLATLRAA
ncbi:MAG TPA: malonate decarboxylase holo-[acyl-carrier-protein] synthase [Janthinobacterium sp.]|jgi:phosphoribosyl-dephospho-CoA transferase|nr:malonate decarboxylase holo-[acyl-carrier-protein] synthase [Janthinobacterium sp.]